MAASRFPWCGARNYGKANRQRAVERSEVPEHLKFRRRASAFSPGRLCNLYSLGVTIAEFRSSGRPATQ